MAGIGPAPFCGMLLADMGAEVIRLDRAESADLGLDLGPDPRFGVLGRGKSSIALNLKTDQGRALALELIAQADALIEGFRPGAMERLGLGPDACWAVNERLVFGRVTGWGQDGPLALRAGHDLNYIALSGVLHAIGPTEGAPVAPLNLVGDYGGGAMLLAVGVLAALLEAKSSGKGQVVDAAMIEGSALLMAPVHGMLARGLWQEARGRNILDGGAPWYRPYQTKCGNYISIGAIEGRFYAELLQRLGLEDETLPAREDIAGHATLEQRFAEVIAGKTREEWCAIFEGSDACFAPVLSMSEAYVHPHNAARGVFVEQQGVPQPAPAPRFSRTASAIGGPPPADGAQGEEVLRRLGRSDAEIRALVEAGVVKG